MEFVGKILLMFAIGVAGTVAIEHDLVPVATIAAFADSGCRIKGNVSHSGGERIYHVPGQYHYRETQISFLRGERWFCSEAEARAAGWRRSGI